MRVLICAVDQPVCPPESQAWMDLAQVLLDPSVLGLTPQSVLLVASYGAVPVLGAYLLGYGIGLAKGLIRKV